MQQNRDRFDALVHYICWRCSDDPSRLGAVKLNKVLWRADFNAFYYHGQSITGTRYLRQPYGPVPAGIRGVLSRLEYAGALTERAALYHGFTKKEYEVHAEPNAVELFTAEEIALVDEAIKFVTEQSATSISNYSHDHVWHAAADGEELPYSTIFAVPGKITADEREWAQMAIEAMA